MEELNGPFLYESMFVDDPEGPKLAALPGVDELLATYKDKFTNICQEMFEFGLAEHQKRQDEVESFFTCISEAAQDNKNDGVGHIQKYLVFKRKVLLEICAQQFCT